MVSFLLKTLDGDNCNNSMEALEVVEDIHKSNFQSLVVALVVHLIALMAFVDDNVEAFVVVEVVVHSNLDQNPDTDYSNSPNKDLFVDHTFANHNNNGEEMVVVV